MIKTLMIWCIDQSYAYIVQQLTQVTGISNVFPWDSGTLDRNDTLLKKLIRSLDHCNDDVNFEVYY